MNVFTYRSYVNNVSNSPLIKIVLSGSLYTTLKLFRTFICIRIIKDNTQEINIKVMLLFDQLFIDKTCSPRLGLRGIEH